METQQTNINTPQEKYFADRVRFYKAKFDGIAFKMDNYQHLSSEDEIFMLWVYRADKLYDDHRFEAEIETFRFDTKPKKKYNKAGGKPTGKPANKKTRKPSPPAFNS